MATNRYFSDIAPTLSKRSPLRLKFPIGGGEAGNSIVVPSDPNFDANAGSAPAPESAIGGAYDGRIFQTGGYPVSIKGKLIGTPGAGTHSLGNWQSDNAIDIGAPNGTPILATQDGVINKVFVRTLDPSSQFAGYQVHLGTGDNEWFYTHMSRLAKGVKPGSKVKKGQVIGYNGSANGVAHLHLGVKNGNPLDLLGLR
jgi:murein DD-endopeptidase MepM/ murein hydrolase activator NlpD